MKKTALLVGAAAVGGVLLAGGCKSDTVMDNRPYVPVAQDDQTTIVETPYVTHDYSNLPPRTIDTAPPAGDDRAQAPERTVPPRFSGETGASAGITASAGSYTVKKGDTVGHIARAHGVRVSDMLAANSLTLESAKRLQIGQVLVIPEGGKPVKKTAEAKPAKKSGSDASRVLVQNGEYTVQSGDNVWTIAKKLKVKHADLMAINGLTQESSTRLQVGQKLKVPGAAGAATATGPAAKEAPTPVARIEIDTPADASVAVDVRPNGEGGATVEVEEFSGNTVPESIEKDISVEDFARQKNISADTFRKLNKDDIPQDGILKAGDIVFIPGN